MKRRDFCRKGLYSTALALAACHREDPSTSTFLQNEKTGFPAEPRADSTPALINAIENVIANGGKEVLLPPGELHCWPDAGTRKFLHISNNDDREYQVAGLLEGVNDLTIRGQDTSLVFHGMVVPFVVQNASNIHFENFSIDWEVPFHCEGRVDAVDPVGMWMEVTIPEQFKYDVRDGEMVFTGEGFEQVCLRRILEMNPERRETAYMAKSIYFGRMDRSETRPHRTEKTGPRQVRVTVMDRPFRKIPKVGNHVILMPQHRWAPAFFVEDSSHVGFRDVTIHHSGCMGVIAQTSENITLERTKVVPSNGRFVSTPNDATHFVNCAGTISIEDGNFSNHIDDAVNVHGIYVRVLGKTGPNSVRAEYHHFQQRGVRNLSPGDRVTIADHRNVEVYYTASVTTAAYESERYVDVTFDQPLPDSVAEGDVINVLSRQPNLLVRGNRIGKNRARGMLVSTLGTVLVEDNQFHSHGTAIRISGGVDDWYESGPTHQIMIRNNVFDHCKYGGSGSSIIDAVAVDADDSDSTAPYHETIIIEDNLFRTEHGNLVTAYRVGNLSFTNNRIIVEPYQRDDVTSDTPFELEAVGSFSLAGNIVKGKSWAEFQQQ